MRLSLWVFQWLQITHSGRAQAGGAPDAQGAPPVHHKAGIAYTLNAEELSRVPRAHLLGSDLEPCGPRHRQQQFYCAGL